MMNVLLKEINMIINILMNYWNVLRMSYQKITDLFILNNFEKKYEKFRVI